MLNLPEVGVQAALEWPKNSGGEFIQFISDSPVGLILFRELGLTTTRSWVVFHFIATILAISLMSCWVWYASPVQARWRSARLMLLTPFAAILLSWVGSYDPFTVIAIAMLLFALSSGRWWLELLAGALLGFQHFEHGVLTVVILLLTWIALRDRGPIFRGRKWFLPTILGIAVGKGILIALQLAGAGASSGRSIWIGNYLREWTVTALNIGPFLLWSLFAGTWALIVWIFVTTNRFHGRIFLVAAFALGLLATLLSGDRPRVFVIVTMAALAYCVVVFASDPRINRQVNRIIEPIMWLAPPVVFWTAAISNNQTIDPLSMLIQFMAN